MFRASGRYWADGGAVEGANEAVAWRRVWAREEGYRDIQQRHGPGRSLCAGGLGCARVPLRERGDGAGIADSPTACGSGFVTVLSNNQKSGNGTRANICFKLCRR